MHKINHKYFTIYLLLTTLSLFTTTAVSAAQLSFTPEPAKENKRLSLTVDKAEKIAGMKVTIIYNKELLTFIKAEKSKATASFMHVVNDKKPGKVIIVMASANGISGNNLPLLYLEFKQNNTPVETTPKLSVIQIQLMDENLKEIKGDKPEYIFNNNNK